MHLSAEQSRAVTRSGQDSCCVAGPGSGKTRVLVERFVWLIGNGLDPESILAITFTDKAARELKSRLVARFESDPTTRQRIERAPVSTIHGLCQSILREHAIPAGLDPEFAVLDQWQADLELEAAVRTVLDRMAQDSPAAFRGLIDAWASERPAGDLAAVHTALRMSGGAARALTSPPDIAPLLAENAGRAAALLADSAAALPFPSTDAQRRRLNLVQELIALGQTQPPADWLEHLAAVKLSGGRKMDGQDELRAARDLAIETLPIVTWTLHAGHRAVLSRLLIDLETEFKRRLRLIPALDFAGLEEHALTLLESQPDARASLQDRFKAILMDEVQDTNPIQWKIVEQLRSPKSFFAVGDANQAIYGFRDADPRLFAAYQQAVASGGGEIDRLERNYRSRPDILSDVERFSNSGVAPGITVHRLIAADTTFPAKPIPSIEIQRIDAEGEQNESEAMWLAARLVELKRSLLVDDPPRPLRWSDCAILARTSAPFDLIEAACERFAIPCVIARGRNFYEEPEILDLTNWLRVMESSANQPALFGLLRSPFFGYSDEQIFLSKQQGEFPPADARTRIDAMRALRGAVPAELILSRLANETGYFARLSPRGQANFEKFLDLLRQLESASPGDYAGWIEIIASLGAAKEPNAPQTESVDAVQVLTIHKSKGLEFPLVAITGLDRGKGSSKGGLNFAPDLGLGATWRDSTGLGADPDFAFKAIPARRDARDNEEGDRLLYVAMTRAKSHLLLTWREHAGRSPWPRQIERAWELAWPDVAGAATDIGGIRLMRLAGLPEVDRQEAETAPAAIEWRDPLPDAFHAQPAVSATDLARFHLCPYRYFLGRDIVWPVQPIDPLDAPDNTGVSAQPRGAELGSQVHALLAGQQVTRASADAVRLAATFRQSELGRLAAQSRRAEREFDFLFDFDGTLLRGVIDLWFESPSGVTLVDYKTGHPGPDQLAEYRLQLQFYSLALGLPGAGRPLKAFLFLLEHDRAVEVETGDVAARAARSALAQFRQAGETGSYPAQPGRQCDYCSFWKTVCPGREAVE
jgi:ATP-dependent exoDNAse (exonuclease V) beta subunit